MKVMVILGSYIRILSTFCGDISFVLTFSVTLVLC